MLHCIGSEELDRSSDAIWGLQYCTELIDLTSKSGFDRSLVQQHISFAKWLGNADYVGITC